MLESIHGDAMELAAEIDTKGSQMVDRMIATGARAAALLLGAAAACGDPPVKPKGTTTLNADNGRALCDLLDL